LLTKLLKLQAFLLAELVAAVARGGITVVAFLAGLDGIVPATGTWTIGQACACRFAGIAISVAARADRGNVDHARSLRANVAADLKLVAVAGYDREGDTGRANDVDIVIASQFRACRTGASVIARKDSVIPAADGVYGHRSRTRSGVVVPYIGVHYAAGRGAVDGRPEIAEPSCTIADRYRTVAIIVGRRLQLAVCVAAVARRSVAVVASLTQIDRTISTVAVLGTARGVLPAIANPVPAWRRAVLGAVAGLVKFTKAIAAAWTAICSTVAEFAAFASSIPARWEAVPRAGTGVFACIASAIAAARTAILAAGTRILPRITTAVAAEAIVRAGAGALAAIANAISAYSRAILGALAGVFEFAADSITAAGTTTILRAGTPVLTSITVSVPAARVGAEVARRFCIRTAIA